MSDPRRSAVGGMAHPSRLVNATPSIADHLYTAIKADIVTGVVEAGGMVDETTLGKAHGVSPAPIREALRRLEQDGLVVTIPRRGTFVVTPSVQDMQEIHAIRMALEPLAATQAVGTIDHALLDRIQAGFEQLRQAGSEQPQDARVRYLAYDSELHDAILEAAGNRQLASIVRLLHDRLSTVRRLSTGGDLESAIDEVLPLLHALRSGDPAAAADAMRRHLEAADTRRRQFVY